YESLKEGLTVVDKLIFSEEKIESIKFGYSIRAVNIKLHELAIKNDAYDAENGINFEVIKNMSEFNALKNELSSCIKSFVYGDSEAIKYVKEEFYDSY
ncbi:hypothetical protein SB773_30945, partial [Bacillus sp. SIMBA_074]|uniref:hypothetical protein n=1 Tax=Bacillus sp. SIMBA_074 TaxID=3085812 RepID=UPI003979E9FB